MGMLSRAQRGIKKPPKKYRFIVEVQEDPVLSPAEIKAILIGKLRESGLRTIREAVVKVKKEYAKD